MTRRFSLLSLFFLAIVMAAPTAMAKPARLSFWAIDGGWSYHATPSIPRGVLNQNQHTLGIEVDDGPLFLQLSHMTDSFSCPSNELVAGESWGVLHRGMFRAGLELTAFLAHRCTHFREKFGFIFTQGPDQAALPPGTTSWLRTCMRGRCEYGYWKRVAGAAQEHWMLGAMPGVWLQLGRVRLETGALITGAFAGAGDVVFYSQLAVRFWP